MRNKVVIGTRGSKLALWQANWVRDRLIQLYPELKVEIEKIKTTGDKILDTPLTKIGGKGLFVKEIEEALISKRVDIAVHSMKDVPAEIPSGLHISAICKREDPKDAFLSKKGVSIVKLPYGATVGTSSLRRAIQIKALRSDLNILPLRGNVDTRIRKLNEGKFDAIILALAGLKRMGLEGMVTEVISEDIIIPAIGQGAIGIETRIDDDYINELVKPLNDPETALCVNTERVFLSVVGGGCQLPLACHAKIENSSFKVVGMIGDPYGEISIIKGKREMKLSDINYQSFLSEAEKLAKELAEELLKRGGSIIIEKIYKER
ncbi:MAG: hydroxymethylbilane synthase [Thermodesulfovibrio sp.]|nr:hydroxymethylbilane synthase [Thermodesulfovibrio sp.]